MKWSIESSGGSFFVLINNVRALTPSGMPNKIQSVSCGKKKDFVLIRFTEGPGRSFSRNEFDCEGSKVAEKFTFVETNGEFLGLLEESGVDVVRRRKTVAATCQAARSHEPVFNNLDPVPGVTKDHHRRVQKIKEKCLGQRKLPLALLDDSLGSFRPISSYWVKDIKTRILTDPGELVTRLPVLKENDDHYRILGGFHLVRAVKEILDYEEDEQYACLREITCDVYGDLSQEEAIYIGAWHQQKCLQKKANFQDKCYITKMVFDAGGDKDSVREVLSMLEGKCYANQALGTVISVARYGDKNWQIVQEIFNRHQDVYGFKTSFPETLFRKLQGLNDQVREIYLQKAKGTNGLKVARMIEDDRRRENIKDMAVQVLGCKSWEEVCQTHENATHILEYKGNITTPEGRRCFRQYAENTRDQSNIIIRISTKDGIDITENTKDIIQKFQRDIEKEIKKQGLLTEE